MQLEIQEEQSVPHPHPSWALNHLHHPHVAVVSCHVLCYPDLDLGLLYHGLCLDV